MTRRPPVLVLALALALALGALATSTACNFDSFVFYAVTRTPAEECTINPQGEFCDPEGLSAPVSETWAIEHRDDDVLIYIAEEVWLRDPPAADATDEEKAIIRSKKLEVSTLDSCTTERERTIVVDQANRDVMAGTQTEVLRITGPEDCGETPRGQRSRDTITGTFSGAP